MVLLDSIVLEFELFLIFVIALILFIVASFKNSEMIPWTFVVLSLTICNLIDFLANFYVDLRLIRDYGYLILIILINIIIIFDFYKLYMKKEKIPTSNNYYLSFYTDIYFLILLFVNISIVFTIVFIILFSLVCIRKKSITYYTLFISNGGNVIPIVYYYLESLKIEVALEIIFGFRFLFATFFIVSGISALIERKIRFSEIRYKKAYNLANFYRDLVSHDINNILQNINSSVDLMNLYIEKGKNIENMLELIDLIKEQVERGARLISNIRLLSQIEETIPKLRKLDAMEVLKNTVEYFLKIFRERHVNISLESSEQVIIVKANELLRHVFENIILNSIKHNLSEKIEITIKIVKEQLNGKIYYKFQFIDNGIGIPDEKKQLIFKGVSRDTKSAIGMGLGLSLVYKIIQTLNGKIYIEDRVKGDHTKGTIFNVLLPT
ncbi:MAG: sensor histidine kinase [Promethearchaeota archaeon]